MEDSKFLNGWKGRRPDGKMYEEGGRRGKMEEGTQRQKDGKMDDWKEIEVGRLVGVRKE